MVSSTSATRASDDSMVTSLDEVGLDSFVREHHDRLSRLAGMVCRDPFDAADAVQAGLELAWKRRDSLREASALRPWLDRIVVNEAIRIARRRRSLLGRLRMGPREIPVEPIDERAASPDDSADLRAAFDGLPADQRAALVLHLHLGYSVAETATIVGAPIETVRSRLRLGRERLRQALGDPR